MKEIKFRVRRKVTNKVIGFECLLPADLENTDYRWSCSGDNVNWMPGMIYESDVILLRDQYTGLHDKNDQEIYDGDILRDDEDGKAYRVLWRVGAWMVERKLHPDFGDDDHGWQFATLQELSDGDHTLTEQEIVGNVYEHPNLLAQQHGLEKVTQ